MMMLIALYLIYLIRGVALRLGTFDSSMNIDRASPDEKHMQTAQIPRKNWKIAFLKTS